MAYRPQVAHGPCKGGCRHLVQTFLTLWSLLLTFFFEYGRCRVIPLSSKVSSGKFTRQEMLWAMPRFALSKEHFGLWTEQSRRYMTLTTSGHAQLTWAGQWHRGSNRKATLSTQKNWGEPRFPRKKGQSWPAVWGCMTEGQEAARFGGGEKWIFVFMKEMLKILVLVSKTFSLEGSYPKGNLKIC